MPGLGSDPQNPIGFAFDQLQTDLEDQRLSISLPTHTHEASWSTATVRGQRLLFQNERQLDGVLIPQEVGSADVGFSWTGVNASSEQTSASVSVGTTGRRLFHEDNGRSLGATVVTEKKDSPTTSWLYGLSYSNNRTVLNNIPIPIVARTWTAEKYKLVLGAPFVFLLYKPMPLVMTVFGTPFGAGAESSYYVYGPLALYGSYGWQPRVFQNLDPRDRNERFFYEKHQAGAGVRMALSAKSHVSIGYVYDFDRRLFMGRSLTNKRSDVVYLPNAGGFQLRAKLSF